MNFLKVLFKQSISREGFKVHSSTMLLSMRPCGLDMLTNVIFATRQRTIELISPAFWNLAKLFFRRLFKKQPYNSDRSITVDYVLKNESF